MDNRDGEQAGGQVFDWTVHAFPFTLFFNVVFDSDTAQGATGGRPPALSTSDCRMIQISVPPSAATTMSTPTVILLRNSRKLRSGRPTSNTHICHAKCRPMSASTPKYGQDSASATPAYAQSATVAT